ncbi:MAG: DUF3136 domain-containing protein [Vulcanococcus sp.]
MTESKGLTIGELEAKYFLYRKALKALLLEGRSNAGIEKTLCWSRLETLHNCLPRQYKSPDHIRHQLRREIEQERSAVGAAAAAAPVVANVPVAPAGAGA